MSLDEQIVLSQEVNASDWVNEFVDETDEFDDLSDGYWPGEICYKCGVLRSNAEPQCPYKEIYSTEYWMCKYCKNEYKKEKEIFKKFKQIAQKDYTAIEQWNSYEDVKLPKTKFSKIKPYLPEDADKFYFLIQNFESGEITPFIFSLLVLDIEEGDGDDFERRFEIVELLLQKGVNINTRFGYHYDKSTSFSIMQWAIYHGCPKIFRLLVKYGGNIFEKDEKGYSLIYHCRGNLYESYEYNYGDEEFWINYEFLISRMMGASKTIYKALKKFHSKRH